jgi:hypothetical protein
VTLLRSLRLPGLAGVIAMTEEQWERCADPEPLLRFILPRASDRKLRLFACHCYRRTGIAAGHRERALIAGERYADGLASRDEILAARAVAVGAHQVDLLLVVNEIAKILLPVLTHEFWLSRENLELDSACARDIFGNPFHPISVDPSWLTSTVTQLAQGIYADRAFDRLSILADALQDAGCANADLLDHCRGPGPHVRGCWAVDLLLGKS